MEESRGVRGWACSRHMVTEECMAGWVSEGSWECSVGPHILWKKVILESVVSLQDYLSGRASVNHL